jgi:hypothetical protein
MKYINTLFIYLMRVSVQKLTGGYMELRHGLAINHDTENR